MDISNPHQLMTTSTVKQALVLINADGTRAVKLITKAQGRNAEGQMTYETIQQVMNRLFDQFKEYAGKGYKFSHITDNVA